MNENFNLKNFLAVGAFVVLVVGAIYYFAFAKKDCSVETLPVTNEVLMDSIKFDTVLTETDTFIVE
jgi:hypothetical protein